VKAQTQAYHDDSRAIASRAHTVPSENVDVTATVRLAQSGCHVAFGTLQAMYERRLYWQILKITKHREDAEDALQDAMLKAYKKLPSFEGRSHVFSWMSRIAINSALMKLRQRRRSREATERLSSSEEASLLEQIPAKGASPEDLFRVQEQMMLLKRATSKLDPLSREIVQLRLEHDASVQAIAETFQISVAAAKSRLHRARRRLSAPAGSHAPRVLRESPAYSSVRGQA
jgi:RNA polymerase sigma-70 factor, ECF subfamily